MSATTDTLGILVVPTFVAVATMGAAHGRLVVPPRPVLMSIVAGVVAFVVGFFATYTVAWTINPSTFAIWFTAVTVGLLVAALALVGEAVILRGKSHG